MVNSSMIKDKTILITEGTRSVGKHLIKQCIKRGAKQIVATAPSEVSVDVAMRAIAADGVRIQWHICDLTDPSDRAKLIHRLSKIPLDGVMHNAASPVRRGMEDHSDMDASQTSVSSRRRAESPQRQGGARSISPVAFLSNVPLHGVTYTDPAMMQVRTRWQPSSPTPAESEDHDDGLGTPTSLASQKEAVKDLEQDMSINFRAPVELTKGLLDLLGQRPGAFLCFVTPGSSNTPSKAALHSYAKTLRADVKTSHPSIKVVVRETATISDNSASTLQASNPPEPRETRGGRGRSTSPRARGFFRRIAKQA